MIPTFLYGTAWKEEGTERLVTLALEAGFRAIDTANQRKHYFEAGVGQALAKCGLPREALWVQTKFTFTGGQDARLPYDAKASVATQVAQSCASSLEHLGLSHLDSYVLHGPSSRAGWGERDAEAWSAMEGLQQSGAVRALGVSNVSVSQLDALCARAKVAPTFVQNRCYARDGWDSSMRKACRERGIVYQGFSLLTANPQVLASQKVRAIAQRHGLSPAQVVFCFCSQIGMLPLTGTSDPGHMKADLAALGFSLSAEELQAIELLG